MEQFVASQQTNFLRNIFFLYTAIANPLPSNEDWHLIPDGEGGMHMVDINAAIEDTEPMFVPVNDMIFNLFTSQNPTTPHRIFINNPASLHASPFNPANPTRFLIHGWNQNGGAAFNIQTRNRYFARGNFNVIVVDWGAGAQTANYALAAGRTLPAGNNCGDFIDFLNLHSGAPFSSFTVIGFSLGAHVAGISGKRVSRGRVQNVVALDAAGPSFTVGNTAGRVHSGDAIHVQSIHTNTGLLGFTQPIGHSAWYPNGGNSHPGCGLDLAGTCAHDRSWLFFGESIANPQGFFGTLCANLGAISGSNCPSVGTSQPMGGEPLNIGSGVFVLSTNAAAPFAQGWRA